MKLAGKRHIVLLGMMAKMPVAGVVWQTIHYLVGFRRLGYEVTYVEAHAAHPPMFEDSAAAAAFIDRVMRRFDLGDRWCFHALHDDGRYHGLPEAQVRQLYASAELIVNLHGGTAPLPEHRAGGRLVYLETDPVAMQVRLHHDDRQAIELLSAHAAMFTFGENYGGPDCKLPVSDRFQFKPTRQPVVTDFWQSYRHGSGDVFTTVGNWNQTALQRHVCLQGEVYSWSKHDEFLKILDLPSRSVQPFELALGKLDAADRQMLEQHGWRVRDARDVSSDLDTYRQYIGTSRGELSAAKDQNIRLRSGWFSDRAATYLAAGRPVINQDTGFGSVLPTGEGLFAFSTLDDILDAVERINANYDGHRRAAFEIAQEYFNSDVVLKRFLTDVGL